MPLVHSLKYKENVMDFLFYHSPSPIQVFCSMPQSPRIILCLHAYKETSID